MQSFDFRKRFALANFCLRNHSFVQIPFFLPFNLNVKCTQHIRTILFMRIHFYENPQKFLFYKYNFSSRMLVLEKRKKGKCMHTIVSIYSEIKLRTKKIFTSTISMRTFPYRFTPFTPPVYQKTRKTKYYQASVHRQNLFFYLFLIF